MQNVAFLVVFLERESVVHLLRTDRESSLEVGFRLPCELVGANKHENHNMNP